MRKVSLHAVRGIVGRVDLIGRRVPAVFLFASLFPLARAKAGSAAPSATSQAAAPAAPATVRTLPPELWPASFRKRLDVVRTRCAPVYEFETRIGELPRIGCETCDRSPDTPIASAAAVRAVPQVDEWLENFNEGSFSAAGANEVAAEFIGCGMRSLGGGGTYLLEERRGQWEVKSYAEGATSCKTLRFKSGRDALICYRGHFQGNTIGWYVSQWDWSGSLPHEVSLWEIASAQSFPMEVCDYPDTGPLLEMALQSPNLVDIDGDGIRDVRVEINYAQATREFLARLKGSPRFVDGCSCVRQVYGTKGDPGRSCPALDLPKLRPAHLDFLARGDHLVPTPATQGLLHRLNQPRRF